MNNQTQVENKTNLVINNSLTTTQKSDTAENKSCGFTRAQVESLGRQVIITDTDKKNNLDLFCYIKCTNTDNDLLKQCRGVVFNGDTLVMKAFPHSIEYNHEEQNLVEGALKDFSSFKFFDAHEGALLRVFYFKDKWYLSTHRKLDAFRSKWSSKESYGHHFTQALTAELKRNKALNKCISEVKTEEKTKENKENEKNVLDKFFSTLDKKKQYTFLVLNNNDNRIVCQPPKEPTMYHVGTFVDGKLDLTTDCLIPKPKQHTFLNIDELFYYVKRCDFRHLQGVICFGPNNTQIKVVNWEYQDLFQVRGNVQSKPFRYLQVRMNRKATNNLYYLYPENKKDFDEYERIITGPIAQSIYKAYVDRFIKKNYVRVIPQKHAVMCQCHSWHQKNKRENRISLSKVTRVLNEQRPEHLNAMIKQYKQEQREQQQIQVPARDRKNSNSISVGDTPVDSPLVLPLNNNPNPPSIEV